MRIDCDNINYKLALSLSQNIFFTKTPKNVDRQDIWRLECIGQCCSVQKEITEMEGQTAEQMEK